MTKTFRAAPSAYAILVGLLSVPMLIWVIGLLRGVAFGAGFAVAVPVLPLSFSAWLAAFRLSISENTITYRSLFGGAHSARISEIEAIGPSKTGPVSKSPLQFKVQLRNGMGFTINAKPFPVEAIVMLHDMLRPNKPIHATCEDARA